MRPIDLDELLKYPIRLDHYDAENGNIHFVYGVESVIDYAESLPIIDAEPVVRCRDCIYSKSIEDYQETYFCLHQSHNARFFVHSREYCSHGIAITNCDAKMEEE